MSVNGTTRGSRGVGDIGDSGIAGRFFERFFSRLENDLSGTLLIPRMGVRFFPQVSLRVDADETSKAFAAAEAFDSFRTSVIFAGASADQSPQKAGMVSAPPYFAGCLKKVSARQCSGNAWPN